MNNRYKQTSDIREGQAVIFFDNSEDSPAWVLPGGKRTNNKALAIQTARRINNLIRRSSH